jgi:hypothetical protein
MKRASTAGTAPSFRPSYKHPLIALQKSAQNTQPNYSSHSVHFGGSADKRFQLLASLLLWRQPPASISLHSLREDISRKISVTTISYYTQAVLASLGFFVHPHPTRKFSTQVVSSCGAPFLYRVVPFVPHSTPILGGGGFYMIVGRFAPSFLPLLCAFY